MKKPNPFSFAGLTNEEVSAARAAYGKNALKRKIHPFWYSLIGSVTEPMFLFLLASAIIYYSLGEVSEALFMLISIVLVMAISFYQDNRSRSALEKLKGITDSMIEAIRNNKLVEISPEEIVPGDVLVTEEGRVAPADGIIIQSNDLSINEALLTGESFSVPKTEGDEIYQGTSLVSGMAVFRVTAIGESTRIGQMSVSLFNIKSERTPLEIQIRVFVKNMAIIGAITFCLVWGINFCKGDDILQSLLKGLTLAMSILPEEIPVAFTTFMALGAWRLMKKDVIVKQTKTVETLGAATVICTDKTGTITENRMQLIRIYSFEKNQIFLPEQWNGSEEVLSIIRAGMLASEAVPFDPMEKALHAAYFENASLDERSYFKMVHEYPLGGKPPMMTHVWEDRNKHKLVTVKGAPEAIMDHSVLSEGERARASLNHQQLAAEGYRVLGVGVAGLEGNEFPGSQDEFLFRFLGFVAFYDPVKTNIKAVFEQFKTAGIAVRIITGDNSLTTRTIAEQAGFHTEGQIIEGTELATLSEEQLDQILKSKSIFTRMFPDAKLRVIRSLQRQGEIVAMTGDGVNDALALKAAHIGIAMGERGAEVAKNASSIVLVHDDLSRMLDAIADGRRIYTNLKKAIQYIISIHIPIILTVTLPLLFGWYYPNIFTPVHVIFLELVMGPTCSIVYENEPMEPNTMRLKPRKITETFLSWNELRISIVQGMAITTGSLGVYQVALHMGMDESETRTLVFVVLISANIFLTLINRSFYFSIASTMHYKNRMIPAVITLTVIFTTVILVIPVLRDFFRFSEMRFWYLLLAIMAGAVSVLWMEVYKGFQRKQLQTLK